MLCVYIRPRATNGRGSRIRSAFPYLRSKRIKWPRPFFRPSRFTALHGNFPFGRNAMQQPPPRKSYPPSSWLGSRDTTTNTSYIKYVYMIILYLCVLSPWKEQAAQRKPDRRLEILSTTENESSLNPDKFLATFVNISNSWIFNIQLLAYKYYLNLDILIKY